MQSRKVNRTARIPKIHGFIRLRERFTIITKKNSKMNIYLEKNRKINPMQLQKTWTRHSNTVYNQNSSSRKYKKYNKIKGRKRHNKKQQPHQTSNQNFILVPSSTSN